jgi:voltage-gated potassium channel
MDTPTADEEATPQTRTPDAIAPKKQRSLGRSQEAYDRFTNAVDTPLMVLTILWLPILIIPLIKPVHGTVAETFTTIDYTVWAVFALEYAIKLFLSPSRGHFFKTHLLDLLIVAVPFFRPARAGRLINLTRLGRIAVVLSRGIKRAREVLAHRSLQFVLLTAMVMIFASAGLVTIAERSAPNATIHNYGQGLWWAIVTVTSVGYGDRFPVTGFGQGVAVVMMVVGVALIGILTATIASFFVGQDLDSAKSERNEIKEELQAARDEREHLNRRLDEITRLLSELQGQRNVDS